MAIFNMSGGGGKGYDGPYFLAAKGPAPDGFHVPTQVEFNNIINILVNNFGMDGKGASVCTYLKMPMAGNRNYYGNANVNGIGSNGSYWTSSTNPSYNDRNPYFYISTKYKSHANFSNARATGSSIRCLKNIPEIPNSSWTTLYQGSGNAGIFWNSSLGLISISGNGTTWYTIQDKNIGATTVYNQGDSIIDANSGYFFQRGNNYGFPHSGSVTTTTSKVSVDQTVGNTYSSSQYYIGNDGVWNSIPTATDIRGPKSEYVIIDGNNYYK